MPNDHDVEQLLDDPNAVLSGDSTEDELFRLATKTIAEVAEKHYNAYREELINKLVEDPQVSRQLIRMAILNAASVMGEEERDEALKKINAGVPVMRAMPPEHVQREVNEIMLSVVIIGMGYMAGDAGAYFSINRRDELLDAMLNDAKGFAKKLGGSVGIIEMRMTDGSAERMIKERIDALRAMGIDIDLP